VTNAIAQIFDKPSALPSMLGDLVKGVDPLGSAIFKGTADVVHGVATNPLLSAAATGVAGYFGGPWGAAAASSSLSRERGDSLEKSLGNGAIAGGLTYAAGTLGSGDAPAEGYDGSNGVDYGANQGANPSVEYTGETGTGLKTLPGEGGPSAPTLDEPVPEPSTTPTDTPKPAADATTPEKSTAWDTAKKTATQVGTTAAITTILAPKKPDQPTPTIKPVTEMPDPLAQEAARRRSLVEQIMRRGRTSTILTDSRGA
jgi:hypothetical protein